MSATAAAPAPPRSPNPSVVTLVTLGAIAATVAFAIAAEPIGRTFEHRPVESAEFLLLTLLLQLFSVPVGTNGAIGVSAIGMIACAIALGPGAALVAGALSGLIRFAWARGVVYRAVFDAAQLALSGAAAGVVYDIFVDVDSADSAMLVAAFAAGVAFLVTNNGLLCLAIGLDEDMPVLEAWRERFAWARYHYLAFGPLAFAAVEGQEAIGLAGLVAFTLPPGLLLLSVRQYVERTKRALEKERAAKERFRMQSRDMKSLFDLASGLSVRSHDRRAVAAYAEEQLTNLFRASATVINPPGGDGTALQTGGKVVGRLHFVEGPSFDADRWERLHPAILPHLATTLESADLVERVWRTHLETIAALSRSMEAKDYYTGSHTERVAAIGVALARRLGFVGQELDAVEVGALLHDIGKIGVPERILNKPDALDEEEWQVMKEHPIISEHILAEVDLHPLVRQIARHSHERYDGAGYPDGLAGEDIPLAARIVLVADAIDALTTDRPYRPARHLLAALQEIREHTGSQFCPQVVAALEQVFREEPHVLGVGYLRAVEATSA